MSDLEKIIALAKDIEENTPEAAIVLYALAGAIEVGTQEDLAAICANFCRQEIERIDYFGATMN